MYRFGYMYLCFSESWASPVSGSGCTFYGLLSVHWNSYYHEDIQCKQMWLNNTAQLSIQQNNHIVGVNEENINQHWPYICCVLSLAVSACSPLTRLRTEPGAAQSCGWWSGLFKCSLQCAAAGLYLLQNYEKINNKLWIAPMSFLSKIDNR